MFCCFIIREKVFSVINIYRVIFIVLILLISYLTIIPFSTTSIDVPHLDKLLHFLAFFVLMTFLDLSTTRPIEVHLGLILCLLLYALAIEVIQYTLPYRSADLYDIFADCLGMLVYFVFIPRIKKEIKI